MNVISTEDEAYWGIGPDALFARNIVASGARSGLESATYVLGDPNDADAPVGVLVRYPPNWEFPRHSHRSARMEVIITGSIIIDDRVLGPGSIMTADENEMYGPHSIGPEGCITVEIMTGHGARGLTVPTPDGDVFVNFEDPDCLRAMDEFMPS